MRASDVHSGLTADVLRSFLDYDRDAGSFTWIRPRSGHSAWRIAGTLQPTGYRTIKILGRTYAEHRLAWLWMTGEWPKYQIDHRNTVKSDNRWENLREATPSQNLVNQNITARNTSGLKNVVWYKSENKWAARINKDGKRTHLGYFDCPAAAFFAAIIAGDRLHGQFYRPSARYVTPTSAISTQDGISP